MRKRNINIFLSLFILFISLIFTLKIEKTPQKFVDSYFIISSLVTFLLLFKLLLEKGAFNVLGYSWYKTKAYILFFLPKYRYETNKEVTFSDYLAYRETKKWGNLNTLILTAFIHLVAAIIFSLFYI